MSTDTHKYEGHEEPESRHSALEELYRDERRPALLLLTALVIAAIFFALGIMVGRWTALPTGNPQPAAPNSSSTSVTSNTNSAQQSVSKPSASNLSQPTRDPNRRYTLLIATYNAPEDAQPLIRKLEQAGYTDVRTSTPRAGASRPKFSVLVGRFTRQEALDAAKRLRATDDPKIKNTRVIEDPERKD
jgi:septal ring-binding cell division protein DamX